MIISGIYKIQSKLKPDRIYVWSAVDIFQRWRNHLSDLRLNKHHSSKLQNHSNKYGESDLVFSVLLGCAKEELIKHEQFFIDSINPFFNNCKIAGNSLGFKHSKESRIKISKSLIGSNRHNKPHSEETKRKLSEYNKNQIPWHKGKAGVYSDETLKKMSLAHIGQVAWNKNKHGLQIAWNKGLRLSKEAKSKMSKRRKEWWANRRLNLIKKAS